MESTSPQNNNNKEKEKTITTIIIPDSPESEQEELLHSDITEEEEESQTEGKPSPPLVSTITKSSISITTTTTTTTTKAKTPPRDRSQSHSPTRSKKRAIDTMLDGEEDKECINVQEKPPPPIPKRTSSQSPVKSARLAPPSPPSVSAANTFMDHSLYIKGDANFEFAREMLDQYRLGNGALDNGGPILEFFDKWIKEIKPGSIVIADALFDLLLEEYHPTTDEPLVARIPLVMNQILQRKRKETVAQLFRVTILAVRLTLNFLSETVVGTDHTKIKGAFEFLKTINNFTLQFPATTAPPRAFQGVAFDKHPYGDKFIAFRVVLLGQYCHPATFTRFAQLIHEYATLDATRNPVLAMMTLIGEVTFTIYKGYSTLKHVGKLRERLMLGSPKLDLNEEYQQIHSTVREVGKFIFAHLVKLIQTEKNPAVLSVAQLTMATASLRTMANIVGPLDRDDFGHLHPAIAAMQMTARLAFEGFQTETKRRDILDWSISWYKRQIELDYGKQYKNVTESEAVGQLGLQYIGELFRDRRVLDYITVERTNPPALSFGFLFFVYPLRAVQALHPADLDSLYHRFVTETSSETYHRAYWEGLRQVMGHLDNELLRVTILSQIQSTTWSKLHFQTDPANNSIIHIVAPCVEAATKDYINSAVPYDATPLIKTLRYLLKGIYVYDLDDLPFRVGTTDLAGRVFAYYPMVGRERTELAEELFESAARGPQREKGGDLHLLRALLQTDPSEWITDWNRDECISRLCHLTAPTPSLPEIIVSDLSGWKARQYMLGLEHMNRAPQIEYRIQFLLNVLAADKNAEEDGYVFPRKVLEEFWNMALVRQMEGGYGELWGGDAVTDSMRQTWFGMLASTEFRRHSGLDEGFLRFFIEDKLPGLNMVSIRSNGWEFITKAIEALDTEVGMDYVLTPMPLLWKIVREAYGSSQAMKFMTGRLLRANVPSLVHQEFVQGAIDMIVALGNRNRKGLDPRNHSEFCSFKATFETLSMFLIDYKKSVHEKDEEITPASTEVMDVDPDKKAVVARCTQSTKDYRDIQFAPDTTLREFHETIASKLSLIKYRAFAQGREITRKESEQSKTLAQWGFRDLEAVMLQVQQRRETSPTSRTPRSSPSETWVSARFGDFYHLLSGEPRMACMTSHFLCARPAQPKLVQKLQGMEIVWEEIFSSIYPWELHYTLFVLFECVKKYLAEEPGFEWVATFGEKYHGKIVAMVEWLSQPQMTQSLDWTYCNTYAVLVLDGYLVRWRDSSWVGSLPLERLITSMLNFLRFHIKNNYHIPTPVMNILAVLSTIDAHLWLKVVQSSFEDSFFALAIDHVPEIREPIWNAMQEFFTSSCQRAFAVTNGNGEQSDSDVEGKMQIDHRPNEMRNIVSYLWQVTVNCLRKAKNYIPYAAKAFSSGASMLRVSYKHMSAVSPDEAGDLLRDISKLSQDELFEHRVQETVLTTAVDYITLGWTRMLQAVLELNPSDEFDELIPKNFVHGVIETFLFPKLPKLEDVDAPPMEPYCIHSETRTALFDLVLTLVNTPKKRDLLSCFVISRLLEEPEVFTDENYIDRSAWVQAPSRLTGIHNLSNTCYMNSLVNQLFMNLDFRNFLFGVEVEDPENSQSLLHQLQYLFARLQLGNDKAAIPHELAHSIIDFEGLPINIHVQMDVDEFFNLLFDRIEGQFANMEEKMKFRRLYGGALCHTIKSRECAHVSSREEDFAAIQCDVRGKATLEESLASYVRGEMMDGDNKYSCEACGRHVDAVKQISIKSLPDNLIFHLKRFEYMVDIGKRIKINDYFQFPREIDLFPYTLGHIEMQEKGIKRRREDTEEIYELVGVLVHTGTAESGHYYSYIRDPRPQETVPDPNVKWYEFNDSEVKPWRLEELDHWCFGGQEMSYDPAFYPEPPTKSYSAYMLFYRKRPKALSFAKIAPEIQLKLPPPNLVAEVERNNDFFTRRYVTYGEDLSMFVAKLLKGMPTSETSRLEDCEIQQLDDHIMELYPLVLGLHVYRLVVSRLEFRSSVEKFCNALKAAIRSSPAARHYFYAWLLKTAGCLKELLLTNTNDKARSQSGQLIADALTADEVAKPRTIDPQNGIECLDLEAARNVIVDLANLVYTAGDNWRSWSEYFETLTLIAKDQDWARLLIEENMITNCAYHFLHVWWRGKTIPTGFVRLKYPDNERVRPNYKRVVGLIAQLISEVAVPMGDFHEHRNFHSLDEPGLVTGQEWDLLFYEFDIDFTLISPRRNQANLFVYRMFDTGCDVGDVTKIVKWMFMESILREGMQSQEKHVVSVLYRQADPIQFTPAETLEVIWKLVQFIPDFEEEGRAHFRNTMFQIVKLVRNYNDYLRESFYGMEYLNFWRMVSDLDDPNFRWCGIQAVPLLASQLMYSNEGHVRDRMATWLHSIIPRIAEDEENFELMMNCARVLYDKLVAQTGHFLDRKLLITERVASIQSVVQPVLQILRLLAASFPGIEETPDDTIESLQNRMKVAQDMYDSNYFFQDMSDDDMEDMETDDEESIVESSPYP